MVPNTRNDRTRLSKSKPKDIALAMILGHFVFLIPSILRIVEKYRSPSKGNKGSMFTIATLKRIKTIQLKAENIWKPAAGERGILAAK